MNWRCLPRLHRLKRQLAERDEELAILQRPRHTSRSARNEACLYWKHQAEFSIKANVPRAPGGPAAAGITWCQRRTRISTRQQFRQHCDSVVPRLLPGQNSVIGAPRLTDELRAQGYPFNVKPWRQACAVRDWGQRPPGSSARSATSAHGLACVAENLLSRIFTPVARTRSGQETSRTSRTDEGWLYLAVVIDPWSRAVIGWSMSPRMTAQLASRCPADGAVSGVRGPGTLSFTRTVEASTVQQIIRRNWKRHNLREAWAQKVAATIMPAWKAFILLKVECIHGEHFISWEIMRATVFNYIECDYNRWRAATVGGGLCSPEQFENQNPCFRPKGPYYVGGISIWSANLVFDCFQNHLSQHILPARATPATSKIFFICLSILDNQKVLCKFLPNPVRLELLRDPVDITTKPPPKSNW